MVISSPRALHIVRQHGLHFGAGQHGPVSGSGIVHFAILGYVRAPSPRATDHEHTSVGEGGCRLVSASKIHRRAFDPLIFLRIIETGYRGIVAPRYNQHARAVNGNPRTKHVVVRIGHNTLGNLPCKGIPLRHGRLPTRRGVELIRSPRRPDHNAAGRFLGTGHGDHGEVDRGAPGAAGRVLRDRVRGCVDVELGDADPRLARLVCAPGGELEVPGRDRVEDGHALPGRLGPHAVCDGASPFLPVVADVDLVVGDQAVEPGVDGRQNDDGVHRVWDFQVDRDAVLLLPGVAAPVRGVLAVDDLVAFVSALAAAARQTPVLAGDAVAVQGRGFIAERRFPLRNIVIGIARDTLAVHGLLQIVTGSIGNHSARGDSEEQLSVGRLHLDGWVGFFLSSSKQEVNEGSEKLYRAASRRGTRG